MAAGKRDRTAHGMRTGRGSSRVFHNEAGWGGKKQGEGPEDTAAMSRTGTPHFRPHGNGTSTLSLADKPVQSLSVSGLNCLLGDRAFEDFLKPSCAIEK